MKTVVIVDDHPIYRIGLKDIIIQSGEYKVVGEADTSKKARNLIREIEPDIAVIDIALPDSDGLALIKELRKDDLRTKFMIISAHSKFTWVKESIEAGAIGYVIKESGANCIIKCLEAVGKGQKFYDRSLSDKIYDYFSPNTAMVEEEEKYSTLTSREQEIFRCLAEGISIKEIGKKLNISPKTVSTHRANIMAKLGLETAKDIFVYATKIGIIDTL